MKKLQGGYEMLLVPTSKVTIKKNSWDSDYITDFGKPRKKLMKKKKKKRGY